MRGCLVRVSVVMLFSLAVLGAMLARLARVARPEVHTLAALDADGAPVVLREVQLRRPGSPHSRSLGWTLTCAERVLASANGPAPTRLSLVREGTRVAVRACVLPDGAALTRSTTGRSCRDFDLTLCARGPRQPTR